MISRHAKKYCDENKAGQGLERAGVSGIEEMIKQGMEEAPDAEQALLRQSRQQTQRS